MDRVAKPVLMPCHPGGGPDVQGEIEKHLAGLGSRLDTDVHVGLADVVAVAEVKAVFDLEQHGKTSGGEVLMG